MYLETFVRACRHNICTFYRIFLLETCFCICKWSMSISLHLVQSKNVKMLFKHFPPYAVMYRKTFVCLCRQTINMVLPVVCIPFSIRFMLCQIWITCINFKTFEEYLQELERGQTDGQTDGQTNRMHKHFSTFLESVKKCWNKISKDSWIYWEYWL